jgi:DNA-binding NarL/FixJ family response regulator
LNVTLPGTFMLGAVSGYIAELALATRRVNEASALFEEALEMNKSMGALPALARNQVSLARLLLRSGRSNDHKKVQRLIAAASAVAGDLGLGPVRRAIAEIGNVSVAASLTGREIDILKTIATGLSNNGIAEALNISHSTVATHIRNIFRKICVANRTEAADYARRSGLLDHD